MSQNSPGNTRNLTLPVEAEDDTSGEYTWPHWDNLSRHCDCVKSALGPGNYNIPMSTESDVVSEVTVRLTEPLHRMVNLAARDPELPKQYSKATVVTAALDVGYNLIKNTLNIHPDQYGEWVGEIERADAMGEVRKEDILAPWRLDHTHEIGDPVGYCIDGGKYENLQKLADFLCGNRAEVIRHVLAISLGKYYDQQVFNGEFRHSDLFEPYLYSFRNELERREIKYFRWKAGELP